MRGSGGRWDERERERLWQLGFRYSEEQVLEGEREREGGREEARSQRWRGRGIVKLD